MTYDEPNKPGPISSQRRMIWRVLAIIGLLLLLITGYKVLRLRPILLEVRSHGQNLLALRDLSPELLVQPATLQGMAGDVEGMHEALSELRKATRMEVGLLSHLGWIPKWGSDLVVLPVLLDLGVDGTGTAHEALTAVLPVVALHQERPLSLRAADQDPAVAAALAAAQPHLQAAQSDWTATSQALQRLQSLPPAEHISPRIDPILDRARPLLPVAEIGLDLAAQSPATLDALAGLTRPRTFLILLQNPWEIRPTGGFISAVVLVTVAGGKVELSPFINSWDVDLDTATLPAPPASLNRAIWAGKINFLNSNWSPDYPTSASWAQELFQLGRDISLDGAIALDPTVIQSLLQVIGPVQVAEYDTSVSADNMWEQLTRFHDEPLGLGEETSAGEKLLRRKEFLAYVAAPLIASVREELFKPQTLSTLALEMVQDLDERHLLVALNDEAAAAWLAERHWDGGLMQNPGDYLQIVDANVGFNKVDARVSREIEYSVALGPAGDAIADLSILYTNHSQLKLADACRQELPTGDYSEGWVDGCYWTYLQVLAPAGSQLLQVSPDRWPANTLWEQRNPSAGIPGVQVGPAEKGRQVFGIMVLVPPGKQQLVHLQYQLPVGTWSPSEGYRLYFQKQSGTIAVSVRVAVTAPDGAKLVGLHGDLIDEEVVAEGSLAEDVSIHVGLQGSLVEELARLPTATPTPTPTIRPSPTAIPTATVEPSVTEGPSPTPVILLVTATPTPFAVPTGVPTEVAPQAIWNRIRVPSVNIDAAIVEVGWKLVGPPEARRAEWEVAAYAAGHHKDSVYPGQVGNVVLSGHHNILGEVFRNLWDVKPGADIFLMDSNGIIYRYRTRETSIFLEAGASAAERAAHLRYLERKPEAVLTLVTCWPYESNTHRTIVVADLVGIVDQSSGQQ